jgi:3-hydroxyisobutyrate dehydrogenase-like beta-hydroxyacid dehydrogenase
VNILLWKLCDRKTIGIIGAGSIGKALAQKLSKAGYSVQISNGREPETLADVVHQLGANTTAVTNEKVAQMMLFFWLPDGNLLRGFCALLQNY